MGYWEGYDGPQNTINLIVWYVWEFRDIPKYGQMHGGYTDWTFMGYELGINGTVTRDISNNLVYRIYTQFMAVCSSRKFEGFPLHVPTDSFWLEAKQWNGDEIVYVYIYIIIHIIIYILTYRFRIYIYIWVADEIIC